METMRIVAVMPWGTSTRFVPADQVEEAKAEFHARGAEQVYVGKEAEQYQADQAEAVAIQALADRDPL